MKLNKYLYNKEMVNQIYSIASDNSNNEIEYQEIVDIFFEDISYDITDYMLYKPSYYIISQFVIDGFNVEWLREEIENFVENLIKQYDVESNVVINDFKMAMLGRTDIDDLYESMEVLGGEICLERGLDFVKFLSINFNI